MEKPTIYLSSTREMRSQNISLPPKVKKQGYTQNHNLPEKKPQPEISPETSAWAEKSEP